MQEWYRKYPLKNVKFSRAFIDIETDILDYSPDLDKLNGTAYAPVNCATIILDETKEVFTFVLEPQKPQKVSFTPEAYQQRLKKYEAQLKMHQSLMSHQSEFIQDLHDSFDKTYGVLDYKIRVYQEEIELIADIFRLINDRKPNFCLAWNMRFDIQYLYERIRALGYRPESIMCHPDFSNPKCFFKVDRSTFKIEKQYDFFYCSSYTTYICQMRLYASIRKSQHMLKSVSLNAIGDRELRDRKVDYPPNANIMTFPYTDWLLFIKYNIKDI